MKKIILTMLLTLATLTASAKEIRYFTNSQARRVAAALDAQDELMIYCGYEDELATYVIVNEAWAEAVNSKYYEIWLYGFDAYTGEEIYMPVDLSCIWLYNHHGNRMYSAAQYLRFRGTFATPNFYWTMPPYNPFVRHYHDPHFNSCYTYHFHIHRHGWHPGMIPPGGPAHYHPYYTRTPNTPAPVPTKPFTPGVNYPTTNGHEYVGSGNTNTTGTRGTAINNRNGGTRSGDNSNNRGNTGTTSRTATTTTGTTNRGAATSSTTSRGTNTTGTTTGRGTSTTGTTTRGTSNTGTTTRGTNNSGTTTRGTSNTGTTTRGTSNTGTSTRGTSNTSTTTRGTSTRSTNNTGTTTRSTSTTGTSTRGTSTRSTNTTGTTTRGTSTSSSRSTSGTSSRQTR